MTKRRISKASKRRLSIFGTISIIAIIYFVFSLLYNVYTIYSLTNEKNNLIASHIELQEKAEQLKVDIEKLNDPNYLANYAREHYKYSKPGEYILQLEELKELKESNNSIKGLSKQINKNYIIIGLSILMGLIFMYILLKGRKTGKKRKK